MSAESNYATFFEMLHEAKNTPELTEEEEADRRRRARRSFPTVQSIAPYLNGNLPQRDRFQEVQCHDLSTNGMAYFASEPPSYDRIVVALATAFEVLYLTAAVAHCQQVDGGGKPRYLVGCRFLGRINL